MMEFQTDVGLQIIVGKQLFEDSSELVIFGRRPAPFVAAAQIYNNTILINTASPLWSAYTEAGIDMPELLIECICHEEMEVLACGEDWEWEYDIIKAHRVIHTVLKHIGIGNGIDVTEDILRQSQETIYNNTITEMKLAVKRSIQKHRELSGK